MRVKFPDDRQSKYYNVHRLAYMYMVLHNALQLPVHMHVSHLCKFSLCCNPTHLSLEQQIVNNSRQLCIDTCFGHHLDGHDYPNCIIRHLGMNRH